jgi:hypothetical protein
MKDEVIDQLDVAIEFLNVIEPKHNNYRGGFDSFKYFLRRKLGRKLTDTEELKLTSAVLRYFQSDGGTPERMSSMEEIFELKFLTNE